MFLYSLCSSILYAGSDAWPCTRTKISHRSRCWPLLYLTVVLEMSPLSFLHSLSCLSLPLCLSPDCFNLLLCAEGQFSLREQKGEEMWVKQRTKSEVIVPLSLFIEVAYKSARVLTLQDTTDMISVGQNSTVVPTGIPNTVKVVLSGWSKGQEALGDTDNGTFEKWIIRFIYAANYLLLITDCLPNITSDIFI